MVDRLDLSNLDEPAVDALGSRDEDSVSVVLRLFQNLCRSSLRIETNQ